MITKKFRVREELYTVVKYLEWKHLILGAKKEEIKYLVNDIILETIKSDFFNLNFVIQPYGKTRESLGFTLSNETIDLLKKKSEEMQLYMGELIEVCVYIHFMKVCSKEEFLMNTLNKWGIVLNEEKD